LSRSWLEIRAHQRRSLPFYRHHEHRCNRMNLSFVRGRLLTITMSVVPIMLMLMMVT
jgi:hypothetical protein